MISRHPELIQTTISNRSQKLIFHFTRKKGKMADLCYWHLTCMYGVKINSAKELNEFLVLVDKNVSGGYMDLFDKATLG